MANTEGIPDEELASMLSLGQSPMTTSHNGNQKLSRGWIERQRMIDSFESGGDMKPSATVIRASNRNRPIVKSSNSSTTKNSRSNSDTISHHVGTMQDNAKIDSFKDDDEEKNEKITPTPVLKSDAIKERPILISATSQIQENVPKKVSRFKMRQREMEINDDFNTRGLSKNNNKAIPMHKNGFPSFDIPVGSLTRRGRIDAKTAQISKMESTGKGTKDTTTQSQADTILASMTQSEIKESVAEIESVLSPEMIKFLKSRKKVAPSNPKSSSGIIETNKQISKNDSIQQSKAQNQRTMSVEEKSRIGELLSNIKSEEELDEIFVTTMGINNEVEEIENESDLESATKLLRSTAHRQRILGAKTISELLEKRFFDIITDKMIPQSNRLETDDSYPMMLPVALRCLLDLASPEKHTQLFSYTLRSLHILVLLFSHQSNHVYFTRTETVVRDDMSSLCQLHFLNDNVPTPSARLLYASMTLPNKDGDSETKIQGYYSTDSSAESVEKDGKAFYKDPLWTLLSRMRILPCVSHIISSHPAGLSIESVTAICAILSMLSLRSPGAACAIAQHKSILPSLISLTLDPDGNNVLTSTDNLKDNGAHNFVVNTNIATPTIRLLCTLCRQSRSVVASLWMNLVMDHIIVILATAAESTDEWELQKWCVILWRTLLRYGQGLSYTSTILPLSIHHLTSEYEQKFSLAPYYLTSYAVFCDCVAALTRYGTNKNSLSLNEFDHDNLIGCSISFGSHAKSCVQFLKQCSTSSTEEILSSMRLVNARLRLLTSYTNAAEARMESNDSDENIPFIPRDDCIAALTGIQSSILLKKAISIALTESSQNIETSSFCSELEASACSLVYTFFTTLITLLRHPSRENTKNGLEDRLLHLVSKIFSEIFDVLKTKSVSFQYGIDVTRQSIYNQARFAIVRMMIVALSMPSSTLNADLTAKALPLIRSFAFSLIGMIGQGDEAMLAILVSQNILFQIVKDDGGNSNQSVTQVQEVLLREIMSTSHQSQVQLAHSIQLLSLNEIPSYAGGPFHIESLRCDADRSIPSQSKSLDLQDEKFEVLSLPLGSDWLFKLLCGKIDLGDDKQKLARLENTTEIVLTALNLIIYTEKENTDYTMSIPCGSKFYFLLNACLFPEEIIRQDLFSMLFQQLFDLYSSSTQEDQEKAKSFILSCFKHSHTSASSMKGDTDVDSITEDQVLELFFSASGNEEKKMDLSPKYFKAVDDFMSDICTAFSDYGAQYEIFCVAIRFLLMPGFPSRNRIIVLNRLKDLLHLLTTQQETNNLLCGSVLKALERSLSGGLPMRDGSSRDSAELLDTMASLVNNDKYSSVHSGGFFYLLTVGYLARNLASSSIKCECGINAMKRRLTGIKQCLLDDIITVSFTLMKDSEGRRETLAEIIMNTCLKINDSEKFHYDWDKLGYSDEIWDKIVLDLKTAFTAES